MQLPSASNETASVRLMDYKIVIFLAKFVLFKAGVIAPWSADVLENRLTNVLTLYKNLILNIEF